MGAFDENVDTLSLVEDHARAVYSLEDAKAEKIVEVYGRVAKKLRARLRNAPKDSFTAQQIRVTLVQLEGAIQAIKKDLMSEVDGAAELFAQKGIAQLIAEIELFNSEFEGAIQPIDLDLVQIAVDVKSRLINNFEASVDAYSKSLRQTISDGLMGMVVERVGPEVMYQRLIEDDAIGKFFDGEAWKVRRIVRTELHGMYNGAKVEALSRYGEDEPGIRKTLYIPMDARTAEDSQWVLGEISAGRVRGTHGGIAREFRPLPDDPFFYTWVPRDEKGKRTGKKYLRTFQSPPDRPNDRSILIPYHPSWE